MQVASLSQDLAKLFKIPGASPDLVSRLVDDICGVGPGTSLSTLIDLKSTQENRASVMSLSFLSDAAEALRTLIFLIFREVPEAELSSPSSLLPEIQRLTATPGSPPLPQGCAAVLSRVISSRCATLKNFLKESTITDISNCCLRDFDWKLQLIVSSDTASHLRQQIVLLTLYVEQEVNSGVRKALLIELTEPDLKRLLTTFDKIHAIGSELK